MCVCVVLYVSDVMISLTRHHTNISNIILITVIKQKKTSLTHGACVRNVIYVRDCCAIVSHVIGLIPLT